MSGKVPTRSIHGFWRYRLLKTLTKNFNILSNAANTDADVDADAVVTAIALPVLSYRRAKKYSPPVLHLLQAQQALALLYAKVAGRPGTGSYLAPSPSPTTQSAEYRPGEPNKELYIRNLNIALIIDLESRI